MSSLLSTMFLATGAMAADQGALEATTNNAANVNTPGYSREVPILEENPPVVVGNLTFGAGVALAKIESVRDPILQLRIQQETGQQGALNAFTGALSQAQTLFIAGASDIGSEISNLFSSISQLSTNPASIALRQGVLTAASNLTSTFNNTASDLSAQRSNLDLNVVHSVQQVNTLTQQIAGLNGQITTLQNLGQEAGTFIDQRDVLINQLSSLIDVSEIKSDSGITLTTSNGTALVSGAQSFSLTTQSGASGVQHIFSQGNDITPTLSSGALGGLIAARDQKIPALLSSLDTLASGLATAFNNGNAAGFDLNGNLGGALFTPVAGAGSAANIGVAITDPALIAASSDGSAGSNGNLANLSDIQDQTIIAGATPTTYYGNIVFNVGNDVSNGTAELQSSQLVLQQLQDQRGSISGVSLDEEAANMTRYQQAYDAAAHIVTTVNQMLETVINMGTLP
ncbi:MAG TPA: flagellar hook-associated protein FlgK [Candidatus Angelobacter sp.]|nr:flagellar hook-associated protein FlgK [Candidatus Angelobacter sp.]